MPSWNHILDMGVEGSIDFGSHLMLKQLGLKDQTWV